MKLLSAAAVLGAATLLATAILSRERLLQSEPAQRDSVRRLPSDHSTAVRYVALGDSTVEGIGATSPDRSYVGRLFAQLREVYPRAALTNLGVGGATAADVAVYQLPRVISLRPDLVTLSVGPNDITQGRDVEQYEQDLATIFERLTGETSAAIVVNLLPDLSVAPVFPDDLRPAVAQLTAQFNEAVARQAQHYGVQVVDLYSPSREEVPNHQELVSSDLYHPSDAGYARWAEYMWGGVAARIG